MGHTLFGKAVALILFQSDSIRFDFQRFSVVLGLLLLLQDVLFLPPAVFCFLCVGLHSSCPLWSLEFSDEWPRGKRGENLSKSLLIAMEGSFSVCTQTTGRTVWFSSIAQLSVRFLFPSSVSCWDINSCAKSSLLSPAAVRQLRFFVNSKLYWLIVALMGDCFICMLVTIPLFIHRHGSSSCSGQTPSSYVWCVTFKTIVNHKP